MNTYWIVGLVLAIGFFAVGEAYAVYHRDRMNTLSRSIHAACAKFPLSMWICGVFAGAVAAHLWWSFCP